MPWETIKIAFEKSQFIRTHRWNWEKRRKYKINSAILNGWPMLVILEEHHDICLYEWSAQTSMNFLLTSCPPKWNWWDARSHKHFMGKLIIIIIVRVCVCVSVSVSVEVQIYSVPSRRMFEEMGSSDVHATPLTNVTLFPSIHHARIPINRRAMDSCQLEKVWPTLYYVYVVDVSMCLCDAFNGWMEEWQNTYRTWCIQDRCIWKR